MIVFNKTKQSWVFWRKCVEKVEVKIIKNYNWELRFVLRLWNVPKTNGKWRKKRVEKSSGKITDKCRHVRFRWSFFFLFALLVRKENKAAVTKENTQKKKNQQFVFKSGTKTEWLQAIYHLTCAFLVLSTRAKSQFKEANEIIFGNRGDMTAIETQKN